MLGEAMREEQKVITQKYCGQPVSREIWQKYEKEMAENRKKYEAAERVRLARTHQLAITTVIV